MNQPANAYQTAHLLQAAQQLYAEGNFRQVLASLMEGFAHNANHVPYYELAIQALEALNGHAEAKLFRKVLANFESYEPFYQLGYHFVGAWHYEMAIPFLKKALAMSPDHTQIAYELAVAYANTLRLSDALHMLDGLAKHDFWTLYYLHRVDFLVNGPVQELYSYLANSKKGLHKLSDTHASAIQFLDELTDMKERFVAVGSPRKHVRDWHFIQYGACILDFSGQNSGRYGIHDGFSVHIRSVLGKAVAYLEAMDMLPKVVYYLEGTSDAIIGQALGLLLGVPAKPFTEEATQQEYALLVAAQASSFNKHCTRLWQPTKKQSVFAFSTCWSHPCAITPDISGLLSLYYIFPWEEIGDLSDAQISEYSQALANMPVTHTSMQYFRPDLNFFKKHLPLLAHQQKGTVTRRSFWVESPVKEDD